MSAVTSKDYARKMYELSSRSFPEETVRQAKMCLLDYLSCAFLGKKMMEETDRRILEESPDSGCSAVIGFGQKTSGETAALINAINVHATELDDGQRYAMMHLGAPIISALFSAASAGKTDGEDFLRGIILGYEAQIRLGKAIQPSHKLRGFHATGTCGTVGAALAIAAMKKYSEKEFTDVISAAMTDAGGILSPTDEGATLKPYNAARAAMAGWNAARIVKAGLHGPEDVLNGSRGFFRAYADEWKAEELVRDNESFLIETIYRKPYASCRHSHSAVEAALKLREEYGLKPEEIRRIEVRTYALAVKGHDHALVPNATTAKMSIPYSVAVSIVRGDANYQAFEEESLGDETTLELMKKVAVCEDPELSKLVPAKRAAIVTVYTDRGVFTKRVDYPKGEPENPITVKELEEKLFSLGKTAGKSEEELEKIRRAVWNIESDFAELTELL